MSIETTPILGVTYVPLVALVLAVLFLLGALVASWLPGGSGRAGEHERQKPATVARAWMGALAMVSTATMVLATFYSFGTGGSTPYPLTPEPSRWSHQVSGVVSGVVSGDPDWPSRTSIEVSDDLVFAFSGPQGRDAALLNEGDPITLACVTGASELPEGGEPIRNCDIIEEDQT